MAEATCTLDALLNLTDERIHALLSSASETQLCLLLTRSEALHRLTKHTIHTLKHGSPTSDPCIFILDCQSNTKIRGRETFIVRARINDVIVRFELRSANGEYTFFCLKEETSTGTKQIYPANPVPDKVEEYDQLRLPSFDELVTFKTACGCSPDPRGVVKWFGDILNLLNNKAEEEFRSQTKQPDVWFAVKEHISHSIGDTQNSYEQCLALYNQIR